MAKKNNIVITTAGTNTSTIKFNKSHSKVKTVYNVKLSWKDIKKLAKKCIKESISFEEFMTKLGMKHLINSKEALKIKKKYNKLQEEYEKESTRHDGALDDIDERRNLEEKIRSLSNEDLKMFEEFLKCHHNCNCTK